MVDPVRLCKFRANKGNTIEVTINSMGARIMVILFDSLFDSDGKAIKNVYSVLLDSPDN